MTAQDIYRGFTIQKIGEDDFIVYNCDGEKVAEGTYKECHLAIDAQYGGPLNIDKKASTSSAKAVEARATTRTTPITAEDVQDLVIALNTKPIDEIIGGA
jgi:hypothetical protein